MATACRSYFWINCRLTTTAGRTDDRRQPAILPRDPPSLKAPTPPRALGGQSRSLSKTVPSITASVTPNSRGRRAQTICDRENSIARGLYQAPRKASIPTAAAQPIEKQQSRKDITVFVEGQRYGQNTAAQILQGAREGLIDGDALATRPGMPVPRPSGKWNDFRKTPSISQPKPATLHADDGMLELTDALIYFRRPRVHPLTPLALVGLFYGVQFTCRCSQTWPLASSLILLGLGLWGFALMQTMGNAS